MSGRRGAGTIDTTLCRRCQANEPAITVRNESLCKACFNRYVSTKIVKRMETFRVRHSEPGHERTLLLPLSLGPSSSSLLHVLSNHLKGQTEKTGRTGYKLHVLHIKDDASVVPDKAADLFDKVKSRYPEHMYSLSLLSDIFSFEEASSLRSFSGHYSSAIDEAPSIGQLDSLLASLDSATSRADLIQILKYKLTVAFARRHNCEAVLWGDSTTRLAERVLAETAKGRGFSLPWVVADGESPYGIAFYYPMRDLLGKEVAAFAPLADPPLDHLILPNTVDTSVNMKNTTIDNLMHQYFDSVEREYPSIVANVVKTAGKLNGASMGQAEKCELCEMPLGGQSPPKSRLCYGCIRTLPPPERREISDTR